MGGFRGICLPAPLKWVGKPVLQLPVTKIKRYCRHITTTTSVIKACIHRHTYTHIAQVLQKNRHSNTKKTIIWQVWKNEQSRKYSSKTLKTHTKISTHHQALRFTCDGTAFMPLTPPGRHFWPRNYHQIRVGKNAALYNSRRTLRQYEQHTKTQCKTFRHPMNKAKLWQ